MVRTTNYLLIVWLLLGVLAVLLLWYAKTTNESQRALMQPAPAAQEGTPPSIPPPPVPPLSGATPQSPVPRIETRPEVIDAAAGATVPGAAAALVKDAGEEWVVVFGVYVRRKVEEAVWRAEADAEGRIEWPGDAAPGLYRLIVTAPEFAPYAQELRTPAAAPEQIALVKGGVITATGIKERGVPVILASAGGDVKVAESDAAGEARFAGLADDAYAVLAGDPGMPFTLRAEDLPARASYSYPYVITPMSREHRVNLAPELQQLAEVRGLVKGCAAGEITLKAKGATPPLLRTHLTGADGSFRFPNVPSGDYEIAVLPALGKSHAKAVTIDKGDTREIEIEFPLAEIRGAVVQRDGTTPHAGIAVALAPVDGAGELSARADAEGRFAFTHLAPGQYRITLTRDGAEPLVTQVFAGATGAPMELTLKYE